jgi:hypothetical protein
MKLKLVKRVNKIPSFAKKRGKGGRPLIERIKNQKREESD